jgi:hypothetical protein
MEPKTFNEYWEEGCKEFIGEETCKYIGDTKCQWKNNHSKIEIWAYCQLDHFKRECKGRCSKYEEKKSWYKKLFGK